MSPKLSTNLISVGQLVDNNCDVHFSNSGYLVRDQVSGKMIAKGPNVECLFPLLLSPSPVSNYIACNVFQCDNQVWHIVIKPGPGVDLVKGPSSGYNGSTRVNP